MTDRQSAPIDRRRDLMQAARDLFRERGFGSTPVSAIVQRAGVSQGTFYLYFKGKQALLADLRREVFRTYATTLRDIAALPVPADERLARVVPAMAAAVRDNLDLERMFRFAESGEASVLAVREGRSRLALLATEFVVEGAASGHLSVRDPRRTADIIVLLFDQILFETLAFEPEALDAVLQASLRMVLRATGVPDPRVESLVEEVL